MQYCSPHNVHLRSIIVTSSAEYAGFVMYFCSPLMISVVILMFSVCEDEFNYNGHPIPRSSAVQYI